MIEKLDIGTKTNNMGADNRGKLFAWEFNKVVDKINEICEVLVDGAAKVLHIPEREWNIIQNTPELLQALVEEYNGWDVEIYDDNGTVTKKVSSFADGVLTLSEDTTLVDGVLTLGEGFSFENGTLTIEV